MKIKTVFESENGRTFDTEAECLAYESPEPLLRPMQDIVSAYRCTVGQSGNNYDIGYLDALAWALQLDTRSMATRKARKARQAQRDGVSV